MKKFLIGLFILAVGVFIGGTITAIVSLVGSGQMAEMQGERIGVLEVTGFLSDSSFFVDGLREMTEDDEIKAIVIRVDTPGGVVAPAQEIHDQVKKSAAVKPVICAFSSVAASGGYYLSAPATQIVANPGTITGSIGVIAQFPQYKVLMDKLGLRAVTIKSGEFKDTGNPGREMSVEDRRIIQGLIDDMFDQFVEVIVDGRGLSREEVLKLADGRVYTGRQALELGLVDVIGGYWDAVELAGELANLGDKPAIQIWEEPEEGILDLLLGKKGRAAAELLVAPATAAPFRYMMPVW